MPTPLMTGRIAKAMPAAITAYSMEVALWKGCGEGPTFFLPGPFLLPGGFLHPMKDAAQNNQAGPEPFRLRTSRTKLFADLFHT